MFVPLQKRQVTLLAKLDPDVDHIAAWCWANSTR